MYFVYILKNDFLDKHYIGSTNNLERRLEEHNRGQTKSTKKNGLWCVIYTEKFETPIVAKKRERQIKSYKGGNAFKALLRA
jgi:putative endonuclease